MRHLSEVLGCFCNAVIAEMRGKMADNLRKKGPGLLNGIEMIAVNHHRACNVAQPLTPGIDLLQEASRSWLPHNNSAGVRSGGQTSGES